MANMVTSPPRSLRFLFFALAGLSLLFGIWIGVARLGFALPLPSPLLISLHGPLMAVGFLLTLIGLERAATLDRGWVYGVPLLSILSMLSLLADLPSASTAVLAAGSALLLTLYFVELYNRQPEEHFIIMAVSAAVLACGNLLWITETTLHRIVPWWAGFLILMIAGERLELTRPRRPKSWVRGSFRLAVIILIAGLVTSPWEFRLGVRIAGAGMIAMALWLLRYDLAWRSITQPGLPRFMAAGLIAGYFWLAVGGVFWIWFARFFGAGPLYDAMLHTVLLGFVFSMIFAHGPIILPAITQLALPFHYRFYLHAGLLHLSLLVRIAGDLALLPGGQQWGGVLGALAILMFLLNTIHALVSAR
ncbi:MAG: hypothetical protein ACXWZE_17770 [Candidatus Binatia bacterium]